MKRFGVFLTALTLPVLIQAQVSLDSLTATWNNGSTTYNAIEMVITDTGHDAASRMFRLQLGAKIFEVDPDANVILSGTVDGRDVAVDGSKLDGISSGAKIGDLLADGTVPLTADWDVGAFDITAVDFVADSIQFDLAAGVSVLQGQMAWNADEETVDIGLNGAVLQAGQEVHYHAHNNSGVLIPDGTAVMATGTLGASGRITIDLMDCSSIANAKFFLGITTEDIADGTDGKVTFFGKVRGIKTDYATWADGDVLWTDNASNGDLTNVEPTSDCRLPIAFVVYTHATNGTIAVRATDGTYLAEAHDSAIASPANGEVLQHNGTAWVNEKVGFSNLADGTDGELITWDATGVPAAVAVGTATHVLTSNGIGLPPTFQATANVEGTAVLSTGEVGGTKFLREDGDNSSSWQVAGDMLASVYDASAIAEQLVGLTATQTLTNKTLNDITNHIHSNVVHALVRNESGDTLFAGTPVYISGYSIGQELILVQAADASDAATMPALGVLEEDLLNNSTGHTITSGNADNMDTFGLAIGAALYVSETAGELTIDRPTGDALVQKVGIILRAHATMGTIDVVGAGRTNAIPNTMLDTVVRIVDDGNETRQIAFQASGITAGNTRTITMPDADVDLGSFLTSVEGSAVLSTGEVGGTKYLREDGDGTSSWQSIAGGGDALVANPLSQFAATTSLQFKGVISDETGSGKVVFATSPALTTPTGIVTNDVTESTDKNYVTDAESTVIGNTSNTNTGDDAGVTSVAGGAGLTSTGGDTPSLSHDSHTGDVTGATELTIGDDKVTYAKMQNVVDDERIWGRVSGADGVVEELTKAQVLTMLNVADGATVDQTNISGNAATVTTNANLTGVVTSAGNATSIADKALAIAKLADGTDGELITWDSSGVITVVAAGSEDEVLTSNGAGSAPTFQVLANPVESFIIAISDETSALTTGTKVTFRMPYAFTASAVRASLTTAATGSLFIVDIQESGVTVLSTNISIDISEKTSTTAVTPPVIDDADWADDAEITIIIDQIGSSDAGAGGKVTIIGERT